MLKALGVGVLLAGVAASAASAQGASCSALVTQGMCACAAPITPGGTIAQLGGLQGTVVVSGKANYSPVTKPSGLSVGDGVLVGPNSSAVVTMGAGCQNHALPANSSSTVTSIGGCGCLNVESNPTTGAIPGGGGPGLGVNAAVIGAQVTMFVLLSQIRQPSVSAP